MNLIVSVDKNWGIGKDNRLLFHIKDDMELFKARTTGKAVIMGRKTLQSLPESKPLKDRINIVLTRDSDFTCDGAVICHSIGEVLEEAKKYPDVFIIGGGEIYEQLLPYCDTAYVTKIMRDAEADTFMVRLDEENDWQLEETEQYRDFEVCKYVRI